MTMNWNKMREATRVPQLELTRACSMLEAEQRQIQRRRKSEAHALWTELFWQRRDFRRGLLRTRTETDLLDPGVRLPAPPPPAQTAAAGAGRDRPEPLVGAVHRQYVNFRLVKSRSLFARPGRPRPKRAPGEGLTPREVNGRSVRDLLAAGRRRRRGSARGDWPEEEDHKEQHGAEGSQSTSAGETQRSHNHDCTDGQTDGGFHSERVLETRLKKDAGVVVRAKGLMPAKDSADSPRRSPDQSKTSVLDGCSKSGGNRPLRGYLPKQTPTLPFFRENDMDAKDRGTSVSKLPKDSYIKQTTVLKLPNIITQSAKGRPCVLAELKLPDLQE